jgi:DNA/RNA-binding domain of Phe-tRNA-synthetase-like protein
MQFQHSGEIWRDFPEIRAWRRAFTRMGFKPTQYRYASEALLRRFRKDGALPGLPVTAVLSQAAPRFTFAW